MPRLKKRESSPPPDANLTLTAGRSRRTIKPNRKYLNDSVVLATTSKSSSRSSSPGSDQSEDDYRQDEEDDEIVVSSKTSVVAGRKSMPAAAAVGSAKKPLTPSGAISTGRPRGRPPKQVTKTEPVKNLRKEVLKKMDLTTLSVGKPRVVLTPLKTDPKRKLNLDESITRDKTLLKDDAPKAKFIDRSKEDKSKPEVRIVRKGVVEVRTTEKEDSLKKVINPVALKKQQVEKSILDKRAKKAEGSTEDDDEDDDDGDDDEVQIVGITRETNPNLGRKVARKSPLVAKQISPLPIRRVPGKATPPVGASTSGGLVKRKVGDEETNAAESTKKQFRPATKGSKLSISVDSDEDDGEPTRRQTRSSLPTDKSSASASTPNSSPSVAAKSKESPASAGARIGKAIDSSKGNLTRAISMPSLDKAKTKAALQSVTTRPVGLSKPVTASTPKPTIALPTKSKSVQNLADPIRSQKGGQKPGELKSATIRIVDIGDIIKKSKSTADIRKDEEEDSEDSDDSEDEDRGPGGKPKTNNELVATILERKRPINLDHLRGRPPKRAKTTGQSAKQTQPSPRTVRQTVINLTEEDDIDIEDMLATNIVTANKVQKVINSSGPAARGRSRPPASDENRSVPSVKTAASSGGVKTLASSNNNNNVYKANNNGRFGATSTLNRSSSASPHKNPPRILNSTMKLGDNRPFAKLVSNSGNKHYSIDLTDPDNNVKLIASPDSPPQSPIKRSPVKAITRPSVTTASGGLRNASNALNKPIGGAVQRSVSALTSTAGASPKMKKITCYETWYVINIPNNENKPEKPSFAMSMIGLGNEAANIAMPSADWSHKIILTKRKTTPAENDEVFTGDVEDRAISEAEKRNYEPCNIMFRRRTATPGKFNLQYDRAVIFKNETFFINVDGKNCQLVGAPTKIDDTTDIETLLAVVDFVNLKNTCVELSAA